MLAWQVADLEAKRLNAAFLEPAHLLLGLCKCVDIDILSLVPTGTPGREILLEELLREFRRLREAFARAGLDAMLFRRHFRTVLPEGSEGLTPKLPRLHRCGALKDIFSEAEGIVGLLGGVVYPIHLLYALLNEGDSQRTEAIARVGSNEARLRQTLRKELFPSIDTRTPTGDHPNLRRN